MCLKYVDKCYNGYVIYFESLIVGLCLRGCLVENWIWKDMEGLRVMKVEM